MKYITPEGRGPTLAVLHLEVDVESQHLAVTAKLERDAGVVQALEIGRELQMEEIVVEEVGRSPQPHDERITTLEVQELFVLP